MLLVGFSLQAAVVEKNTKDIVFGERLFSGGFADASFQGFNPNYLLSIGDVIDLQVWGGFQVSTKLQIDEQGNVFIPNIGPIKLLGVANKDLNKVLLDKVSSAYQSRVKLYANLNTTQPVKIFVAGFVGKPGLYTGLSSDSVLSYLAKAGGILSESGSYLDIKLKRDGEVVSEYNLYDFILDGIIKFQQLHEGDVFVVGPKKSTVVFKGLVENSVQIEFLEESIALFRALDVVGLEPEVTHLRITRGNRDREEVEYIPVSEKDKIILYSGDKVSAVADKPKGTIVVFVEGEHTGRAEYVLPYGSTMKELLDQLEPSDNSSMNDIQLFREEVAQRQKEMLVASLQRLEVMTFSTRSQTVGEAQIRTADAGLVSQLAKQVKDIEPLGQVVIGNREQRNNVVLKNNDRVLIPSKSLIVSISGEVMFPSATVWEEGFRVDDYIKASGGFSQRFKDSKVVIISRDGSVRVFKNSKRALRGKHAYVEPGDEIMVIPQVHKKTLQYGLDISQIIYQIALTARVAVLL